MTVSCRLVPTVVLDDYGMTKASPMQDVAFACYKHSDSPQSYHLRNTDPWAQARSRWILTRNSFKMPEQNVYFPAHLWPLSLARS